MGKMRKKIFDVEIVKDGDTFIARIILPNGDVSTIESESIEELLNHLNTELEDQFTKK
ncbi:MAG: hypothetical protein QW752_02880 [Thermoplasmata archaeon]